VPYVFHGLVDDICLAWLSCCSRFFIWPSCRMGCWSDCDEKAQYWWRYYCV